MTRIAAYRPNRGAIVSAGVNPSTPFHELGDFVALPRVAALRLAPDGTWLAAAVQTLSADKKKYLTSIWRIDAAGGPARRLTRSAEGEGSPRFLPDGSLLFTSLRADPAAKKDPDAGDVAALWLLPAAGGEARVVAALPGGVTAAEVARDAGAIVVGAPVLPGAGNGDSAADDTRLRQERKDAGITAILHESAPVRFWDHDLGPDQPRLFAVDPDQVQETEIGWAGGDKEPALADDTAAGAVEGAERAANPPRLRDLTPEPGRALDGESFELTPDGASVITGWWRWEPAGESRCELVAIDVASGKRRVLLSVPEFDFDNPRVSPDGRSIACLRERHATSRRPVDLTVVLLDAGADTSGPGRDLLAGWDRWPNELAWAHDSSALYLTADDGGRCPVFRVEVGSGEVTRVTADDGAYTDLNPSPDGRYLYALRAAVDSPPTPVRIDLTTGAEPGALDCPGVPVTLPGRLAEGTAAAEDGQPVRAWRVLPEGAAADQPAPLLLW